MSWPIAGWNGSGTNPNIVRPNGVFSGGGPLNAQSEGQYLDIGGAAADFWQNFTFSCNTRTFFSGYFSIRDNIPSTGRIDIYSVDASNNLTLVGSSNQLNMPAGNPNTWYFSSGSVILTPGNYRFQVSMGDNSNFDNACFSFDDICIFANDDGPVTIMSGLSPVVAYSVLNNDTLNGAAVTTTNTDVTPVTSGPLSIDADGTLTVAPNTPSGTYTITYELCEVGATPANCDTAIATVVVDNPIVANDDLVGPIVSSTTATTNVVSVLANDTFNGNPLVLVDVNLTVVNANPNLRLNADGSVDVLGNTPEGTYVLVYQICEKTNPANCKTATVTVTVVAPVIVATNDDYSNQPIDSSKGTVLDILANDRLNNGTVSAPQVVITIVDANGIAGVTVDAQGKVTIPTGTPVGTYVITYRICDVVNPNNCATATITIVVKDPCDFDDSASSCDILVHNAFSPNNDGRNEVFLIERIENYPDNTVEIYNRWGVLVFEVSGYDNASKVFVGLSEGRVTVNKADALPNGTYYYVVKYKKPISGVMNQKAGFLYLSR
mgnify:FL=1